MVKTILSEETQELLNDVDDRDTALEFIEKYGEEAFREHYDDYQGQVDELGIEPVEAFIRTSAQSAKREIIVP